jgi:hypothetical protein
VRQRILNLNRLCFSFSTSHRQTVKEYTGRGSHFFGLPSDLAQIPPPSQLYRPVGLQSSPHSESFSRCAMQVSGWGGGGGGPGVK